MLEGVGLVVALVALILILRSRTFAARIEEDIRIVTQTPAASSSRELPALFRVYLERAGLASEQGKRFFRIEQAGEMRLRPGAAWRPFRATQVYAVATPAFVWSARFRAIHVVDSLVRGRGRLEARLLGGLPLMRASGAETTRAQLLRYLAEIVWFPSAIACNPGIVWREEQEDSVIGTLTLEELQVELRFQFDAQGDLVRVEGLRSRTVGEELVETPWIGNFSDHAEVNGVRVPTRGEVSWQLDSELFTYWRATIRSLHCE